MMNKRYQTILKHQLSAQQGLSLVELMIALALGLVLTLGVIQVFTSASQTYRLTDRVAQLQEDMRFILGRLQSDVRMTGHYGCLTGNPTNNLNPAGTGFNVVSFGNRAITGWEASDTGLEDEVDLADTLTAAWATGSADAIPIANAATTIRPGTDFFVINGAERRNNITLNGIAGTQVNTVVAAGSGLDQGAIVLLVDATCMFGDLLQKTNTGNASITMGVGVNPGNAAPGFATDGRDYAANATAYEYISTAYYIGTGANGEPGLFRQRLSNVGAPAQELVSGVENMQVLYGVSPAAGGRRATQYVTAANVNDWDNVVSMRIALLMRSANPVQDVAESRTFNLLGTQVTTEIDRRARLMGTVTVAIRNRLQ